jgi:prostasin
VTDVIIHEAYNAYDNTHDVALMRLEHKIVFTQHLSPACLPTNKQEPAGKPARVLGWRFPMSHHRFAESLLLVNVSIYSNPECSRMRYTPGAITNFMVRAGSHAKN